MNNREIDILVAENIFNKKVYEFAGDFDYAYICDISSDFIGVPKFSTNIEDAWEVSEKLGLTLIPQSNGEGKGEFNWFACDVESIQYRGDEIAIIPMEDSGWSKPTATLAICFAALESVGIEMGGWQTVSTNYYFINKESRKEAEEHNRKVDAIFEEASKKLNELPLECDANSRELTYVKWKYEADESPIHIGKRSMGWLPLFQVCEYFESVREMKEWYFENQDDYIIESEYGEELSWDKLKEELLDWKGVKSHFHGANHYISYYADEDGYEWTGSEFS